MGTELPPLMSQSEYARHRGCSRQYVSKLVAAGVLVLRSGGKIDRVASDKVLDDQPLPEIEDPPPARTMPPARAPEDGPQKTTYHEARTIRTIFLAKLARLDYETRQGKLIEAEGVRLRISEHVRALRDGLLGLPDRLSSTLAAETDQRKVHVLLRTEITRELEAMAHALGSA
jgi:hypothetical protein